MDHYLKYLDSLNALHGIIPLERVVLPHMCFQQNNNLAIKQNRSNINKMHQIIKRKSLLWIFRQRIWIDIRKRDRLHLITVRHVVAKVVDVRVDLKGILCLALVQHKVGGEKHEQRELVALALEAWSGNIEG